MKDVIPFPQSADRPMNLQIEMPVNILILSQDTQMIINLEYALRMHMNCTKKFTDLIHAKNEIENQRYDGVIIDWDGYRQVDHLMAGLRNSKNNSISTVLACVEKSESFDQAMQASAEFVTYKPKQYIDAIHIIRPMMAQILQQQKQAMILPVQLNATATNMSGATAKAIVTNISSFGATISTSLLVHNYDIIKIKFTIPGTAFTVMASSSVLWNSKTNIMEVKFIYIPAHQQQNLDTWLGTNLAKQFRGRKMISTAEKIAVAA